MMDEVRALIFDVDGVLVTGHTQKGGWWHVDMEADLGLHPDIFQRAFFPPFWEDIVLGRRGIEECLAPVLADIAPHLDVETLLAYWFEKDAGLDEGLLSKLEALRSDPSLSLHLATNQEHRRANYLWQEMGFEHRFDALHYSADIGHQKPSPEFFIEVEKRTGLTGAALLFFDDQERNVEAARERGWQAHVWTGIEVLDHALVTAPHIR